MVKFADLTAQLRTVVTNWKFMLVVVLLVIFISAAWYTYRTYVADKINPTYVANNEFQEAKPDEVAELYFFYTTWCPHCKNAMPIWRSLRQELEGGKTIKGKTISFIEVDCEKEPSTADSFQVSGYPTIKLVTGNQVIDYDAKPDKATLLEFLNSAL